MFYWRLCNWTMPFTFVYWTVDLYALCALDSRSSDHAEINQLIGTKIWLAKYVIRKFILTKNYTILCWNSSPRMICVKPDLCIYMSNLNMKPHIYIIIKSRRYCLALNWPKLAWCKDKWNVYTMYVVQLICIHLFCCYLI